MKCKKNSKGQFYLIFAIIVMGLVTGLLALHNYTLKEGTSDIKKIKQELQIESQNVLNYIYINDSNREETLDNFTKEFSNYAKNYDIIYITGKDLSYDIYKYDNGVKTGFTNYSTNNNDLTINFNNASYLFNLKEGENFYFIISEEEKGEIYVETNSE